MTDASTHFKKSAPENNTTSLTKKAREIVGMAKALDPDAAYTHMQNNPKQYSERQKTAITYLYNSRLLEINWKNQHHEASSFSRAANQEERDRIHRFFNLLSNQQQQLDQAFRKDLKTC
jgi:hypothetical protein